ncbi:protein CNPPD1-like isoform X2 [Littorina saxatilis]
MDEYFRKRRQQTLYSGELEPEHSPLALTELAVEYFQDLAPHKLGHVDLQSASIMTSQETVSPSSVTMSMMYANRLQRKRPDYVQKVSSSDLFLISMMMASKYLYDEGVEEEVFNDDWAENAGLEKEEINEMEMDFLDALEWEMFIKKDDFDQAMLSVERNIALKEGLKRGWFSYTDLYLLLDDPTMQLSMSDVGLEWLKVVMVSSAAYFAGVMTMVGSTVLVTNASVALASSGLMPGLRTTFPLLLPGLSPSTFLPPLPALEFPGEISPPSLAGFRSNETGEAVEREEESGPMPESRDVEWTRGKSVLDTILSQLMAVLTLKSHMMQFVSAVSDGLASGENQNGSAKKSSRIKPRTCIQPATEAEPQDERDVSPADAVTSRWFEMEESSVELGHTAGSCSCCGKWKRTLAENGLKLDFALMLSASQCPSCCQNGCWRDARARQCPESTAGCKAQRRGLWEGQRQGRNCRTGLNQQGSCWREALASMPNLFPDITIGFSTSMPPPVFAT